MLAKKHIPVLAQLIGTSDRWWLSSEAPVPPTNEWLAATLSADQHIGNAAVFDGDDFIVPVTAAGAALTIREFFARASASPFTKEQG